MHFGVEAESLLVGAAFLGRLRIKAGDGLHAQHLLTCAWTECNAVGAGRRLQRCHGRIRIGFGHIHHTRLFDQIAKARQQLHDSFYDLVEQCVQLFGGGCTYRLEDRTLLGDAINPHREKYNGDVCLNWRWNQNAV